VSVKENLVKALHGPYIISEYSILTVLLYLQLHVGKCLKVNCLDFILVHVGSLR
jgi:hypothetical protein